MSKITIKYTDGSFCVSNGFVDRFLKDANPSYTVVYLYMLRHTSSGNKLSLSRISSDLGLLKSDVLSAFKYWDRQGVIAYNDDPDNISIEILNLNINPQALSVSKEDEEAFAQAEPAAEDSRSLFQPNESVSSAYKANVVVKAIHDDEKLAHLFSIIQQMLNKNLSSNDYKVIYSFIDYLKLPEQVILVLFEYCISIKKTNMRYIEKIAYAWADSGITTLKKAEDFVKQKSQQQSIQAYYKQKFKINGRDFTDTELGFLMTWINEYKADEATIVSAFEKTVLNTGKLSFKYMDSIIKSESSQSDKNTGAGSKFKNYPSTYKISEQEKSRLEKMMLEYEGGEQ